MDLENLQNHFGTSIPSHLAYINDFAIVAIPEGSNKAIIPTIVLAHSTILGSLLNASSLSEYFF